MQDPHREEMAVQNDISDDPRDQAEAIVSSCELLDKIQFQFSDTVSFADGKNSG
jgi:hypothetical protein